MDWTLRDGVGSGGDLDFAGPYQTVLDYFNGRGGGIRTPDPLVPNQMRYQAALRPDSAHYPTRTDQRSTRVKLTIIPPGTTPGPTSKRWPRTVTQRPDTRPIAAPKMTSLA